MPVNVSLCGLSERPEAVRRMMGGKGCQRRTRAGREEFAGLVDLLG